LQNAELNSEIRNSNSEIDKDVSQTIKEKIGGLVGSVVCLLDHQDFSLDDAF
jgi:hypothetical protein